MLAVWGVAAVLLGAVVSTARASAGLYAATYACSSSDNCTASLFTVSGQKQAEDWTQVADFATEISASVYSGMLAADPLGGKWWLVAASGNGGGGSKTLYHYSAGASNVTRTDLANDVTTLQYISAADEFLATWQTCCGGGLQFGAMDPYIGQ